MATSRAATSKAKSKRRQTAKQKPKLYQTRQFWSVILFALGILLLTLTFISGSSAWLGIHNFLFGLFGLSAFVTGPLTIYVAVLIAADKEQRAVIARLLEGAVLMLLISGMAQVLFIGEVNGESFLDKLGQLFSVGTTVKGGGLLSALLGWPLLALFQRVGATIVMILLSFVFFMLLTGITLIDFFKAISMPFRKLMEYSRQRREDRALDAAAAMASQPERTREASAQQKKRGFNIDVAIPASPDLAPERALAPDKAAAPAGNVGYEPQEHEEPLPAHPVISPKIPLDAAADEKVKNSSAQLEELIKKAVTEPTAPVVPAAPLIVDKNEQVKLYDADGDVKAYKFPPVSLLNLPKPTAQGDMSEELKTNAATLVNTLKSFGVETRIIDINRGPTVTRYELQPSAGVKISRITGLSDDIALNLATAGVRIEAPIPNKAAVGIEVPNKIVDVVTLREIIDSATFDQSKSKLTAALGKDIAGNIITADIAKMPHVLIAGSTGSGKSVCINSIIMSLLYKASPDEVRILMVDPKVVELGVYNGIPHLLIPVVTDPRKAAGALAWAVTEMLKRYKLFADSNVRDLTGYNEMAKNTEGVAPLPQIVIIIDELADLMMAAQKEVEDSICRLAQMARAAGMHLVIATQRPSVDVITGLIKANIPSRISFAVSSQVDSRTILDASGAEKLLGRGDMLLYPVGSPKPSRVQGCFVSDKEVESVVAYIKKEIKADYDEKILEEIEKQAPAPKNDDSAGVGSIEPSDEMLSQAIECIIDAGQASTSYLQRRLKLGYARAARLIDEMEAMGIVGPFEGAKPRQVLMSKQQWYEMTLNKTSN